MCLALKERTAEKQWKVFTRARHLHELNRSLEMERPTKRGRYWQKSCNLKQITWFVLVYCHSAVFKNINVTNFQSQSRMVQQNMILFAWETEVDTSENFFVAFCHVSKAEKALRRHTSDLGNKDLYQVEWNWCFPNTSAFQKILLHIFKFNRPMFQTEYTVEIMSDEVIFYKQINCEDILETSTSGPDSGLPK